MAVFVMVGLGVHVVYVGLGRGVYYEYFHHDVLHDGHHGVHDDVHLDHQEQQWQQPTVR